MFTATLPGIKKLIVPTVLEINNLTKYYGKIHALNNVSFSIPEGSVFGILGPNGSGKTTRLGIVMDVLKPLLQSYPSSTMVVMNMQKLV